MADNEKASTQGTELSPLETAPTTQEDEVTLAPAAAGQRIQFIPSAKPAGRGRESITTGNTNLPRRHSIPRVVTNKEKKRSKKEEDKESKHVDVDEHLMSAEDVAQRYNTSIDIEKPPASHGLSAADNEQLIEKHGRNVLTPPKKRHPILKYLDCLKNLFNLLLIVAGILEYILLAIDYKDNFQNVSVPDSPIFFPNDFDRLILEQSSSLSPLSTPSSNSTSNKNPRRSWSRF
jgi:sodium/potassium-transporting ATPase subunit alpha